MTRDLRWAEMVVAAAIAILSAWGTVAYSYGSMSAEQAALTERVATLTQQKGAEDNKLEMLSEQMAAMQATLTDIKAELAEKR